MHLLLRIKIKTLAFQSAEMRREENTATFWARTVPGASEARELLHNLRTGTLRNEARAANLAYGFLLGRDYWQMERTCHEAPNFQRVQQIVEQFSGEDKRITRQRFACWHDEAEAYLQHEPPTSYTSIIRESRELKQADAKPALPPVPEIEIIEMQIPNGIDPSQVLISAIIQALSHGGARV